MHRILLDERLNEELSTNGFVKMPFLSRNEAQEFRALAVALNEESMLMTAIPMGSPCERFWTMDPVMKKKIFVAVSSFLQPMVDRIVDDFLPLGMSLVDKRPGAGEVRLHQHWSFVDENRFQTITIHVPVLDTTRHNGTLEVVPGSHQVNPRYRGPTIPLPFQHIVQIVKERYCEPLDVRFGEAVVFFDSTLHYSRINLSNENRLALNFNLHPRQAQPILYDWDPMVPDHLTVLNIDSDFLCGFSHPDQLKRLTPVGTIPYRLPEPMQEAEFAEQTARSAVA